MQTSGKVQEKKILIVEDNPDSAYALKGLLEFDGHEVRLAWSGIQGIDMARSWQPDALLCDIKLPYLDGLVVARTLRGALPKSIFVAMTAFDDKEDHDRSKLAGFDYHLAKPVDPEALNKLLSP